MEPKDQGEKVTRTACMIFCGTACGALAHVKNGVLTKLEPADFPDPRFRYMCLRGLSAHKIINHPDRLKYPMKRIGERGEGKFQRISWDEALDTIASKLKEVAAKYGPASVAYLNGGLSLPNGALFFGQRFASATGGTFVSPLGCGNAGQTSADILNYGTRMSECYLLDHENPRMYVFWGANAVETGRWKYHHHVREGRERGAKMVFISPLFTATAAKSDEWIPLRAGTDAALALGMINVIVSEGLCDEAFLTNYTVGPFLVRGDDGLFLRDEHIPSGAKTKKYVVWDTKTNKPQPYDTPGVAPTLRGSYRVDGIECKPAFQLLAELAAQYPLEKVSEITDVPPDAIRRFALDHVNLKPVASERGLGMQRTYHGDLAFKAITALAAVTGNICLKRPEEDFFATLNWKAFLAPGNKFRKQVSSLAFYEAALTGKPWPIKAMWVSTANPANSHGNRNQFKKVLSGMEFIVLVDLFKTATADYADILLPGTTAYESTNIPLPYSVLFGGGHPYFQLQPKLVEPYYESKSDVYIFTEVAKRMGVGEHFNKTEEEYIDLLFSGNPALEGITVERLRREGPLKPKPCHPPLFSTPSGRLEFYLEQLKDLGQALPVFIESPESARQPLAQKYPLSFMQMHCRHREHSQFGNVDWMLELDPEPLLHMNSVDAEKRGIEDGDMVVAFNDRGKAKLKARINEGMRPGVVAVYEGWQPRQFAEGSYQELTRTITNPAQKAATGECMAQMQDVLVEVKKAQGGMRNEQKIRAGH